MDYETKCEATSPLSCAGDIAKSTGRSFDSIF